MSDVRDWDRNANNNNDPPPDGAPEGQTAGSVNDCIRENMAAVKRLDDDHNGSLVSGGASGNYIVVSAQLGLTAYYAGMVIAFIANHENPSAASVNVSTLGDRPLTNPYGLTLVGKEIRAGQIVVAIYDATNAWFQVVSTLAPSILRAENDGTLVDEQVLLDYSSAEARLQVKGPSGTPAASLGLYVTDSGGTTNKALGIDASSNARLNGNLTLNADPESWAAAYSAIQIGGTAALLGQSAAGAGNSYASAQNAYFDGNWKRKIVDETSRYEQISGIHRWFADGDGPADTTFAPTERMRLDVNGNLGVGLTPTANMSGISVEAGLLTLKETTTPTADANYGKIYTKADNNLYFQDGAGVERQIAFV